LIKKLTKCTNFGKHISSGLTGLILCLKNEARQWFPANYSWPVQIESVTLLSVHMNSIWFYDYYKDMQQEFVYI